MKKIPSIFERDWNGDKSRVTDKPVTECRWVFEGEGIATRKYDGTAVLVRDSAVFIRYDAKNGKAPPINFEPCESSPDPHDGHWPGWIPFDDKDARLTEALHNRSLNDGTYELCGPKVNGNPEQFTAHILIQHAMADEFPDCPRSFQALKTWLADKDIEGIVWHHPDGRMAKIKKRDFGYRR